MTSDLGDHRARLRAATDLDATLFVEASAGSGKTTLLVARLLELIVRGRARIDQVAAITFTEAAAAELRDRLAVELERVAASGHAGATEAAAALEGLDAAAVTTLHGFARRILAEHPLAVGLPPVFEVLDGFRAMADFDQRWGAILEGLTDDDDDATALTFALACGARLDSLRTVARSLDDNWDRVGPRFAAPVPRVEVSAVSRPIRTALELSRSCADPDDNLLAHVLGLRQLLGRLDACGSGVEGLGVLASLQGRIASKQGRADSWGGRKGEVVDLLAEAQTARDAQVATAGSWALRRLVGAIGVLVVGAAETRRREGRLSFHDLLVLARDAVRDTDDVRHEVAEQYRYLLIDEFQDTDPIQAELAVRLASVGAVSRESWRSETPTPGRLFFVGDPKQSIYRFRRADVELFAEVQRFLVDEPERLTTNFRSAPGIVAWVDAAIGPLFGVGGPVHVPSSAHRRARGAVPPVAVIGAESEEGADDVRALEAADVAAVVLTARDDGWPVGDEGRPARFADVTVLVPTRHVVPALEAAFGAAGIPYRLEASSLVYSAQEVRELLSILHAVDDPTDEASVVAALRSPAFGCGDDDLLRHALAHGSWDYRVPTRLPGPVADGLADLGSLHRERWWREVSTLVGRVIEDRRLLELALDHPQWRERWRRLRFVLDQARQFTETSPGDLRAFLAWADLQAADDARVTETVLPEDDVDAVRVMTVHAAKGLEFPVVVLAGLGGERRTIRPDVVFGPEGPEVAIRTGLTTSGYGDLAEQERVADEAERVRLLYVAATRAQDHLVVSVHRGARRNGSMAQVVAGACDPCRDLWRPLAVTRTEGPPPVPPVPVTDDGPSTRRAWAEARSWRIGPGSRPKTVAATGVARLAGEATERGDDTESAESGEPRPPWRRGRAGTAVGRAVHAVLQTVDLATGEGIAGLAGAAAAAEGVASRAGDVEALARAALDSSVVRDAVAHGRYWRELYVGAPVGDGVVEGFVDLLVEGADGLEVVDYKTDRADDLDAATRHHRLQGAAYAVAVERATGRPVHRCTFLFLRRDGAVAREIVDLAAAKVDVESAMNRDESTVHS